MGTTTKWVIAIALSCAGLGGCDSAGPSPMGTCGIEVVALWIPDPRDAGKGTIEAGPPCETVEANPPPDSGTVLSDDECGRLCPKNFAAVRQCVERQCRLFGGKKGRSVGCFTHEICL